MRITVIGKCPPIEGAVSRRTFDFARSLARLGHDVSYFTNAAAAGATYCTAFDADDERHFADALRGVRHASLVPGEGMMHIPYSAAYETRLIGLAGEAVESSDLVVGWYYQPYGVAAAILAAQFDKPCVLVHAGSDLGRLARVKDLQLAYRCLFSRARLVALGPTTARLIVERLALASADRLITVPHAAVVPPHFIEGEVRALDLRLLRDGIAPHLERWEIDPARKRALKELIAKDPDPALPTIGVYGKIGEQKGNLDVLVALQSLARAGRRFNFVFCGGGHPARIEAFLDELLALPALARQSWLLPFIAPWKVPGFIAACDLIAFLERDFPISFHAPRVPREVLAVGTALLCSREIATKQPFREALVDRVNYIDAADPKETDRLAAAIDFCLADRARLRAIGAAGRALLFSHGAESEDPIIAALQESGLLALELDRRASRRSR